MESLEYFVPLLIVISCVVVTLSFLLLGVNAILNLKINPLEKRIEGLEAGQAKLEKRMDNIEAKLDTLLALIKSK